MKELIKELTKKTIIIFLTLLIFLSYAIPSKAANDNDYINAGDIIAEFAINFYEKHKDEVRYLDPFIVTCRQEMYNGEKCSQHDLYHCDCVGWVSFVIHQALGLNTGGDEGGIDNFIQPAKPGEQVGKSPSGHYEIKFGNYYDVSRKSATEIEANAEPGDIILAYNHVMIYVGNGEVIHCAANLQREQLSSSNYADKLYGVARLTDAAIAEINPNDCVTDFDMKTGAGELDDYGLYWGTTTGRYTGSYTFGEWLFSKIGGFLDYLIGIMTYIIKIPFLGYTNITEAVVNDFLQTLTGDEISAVTREEDEIEEDEEQEEDISGPVQPRRK